MESYAARCWRNTGIPLRRLTSTLLRLTRRGKSATLNLRHQRKRSCDCVHFSTTMAFTSGCLRPPPQYRGTFVPMKDLKMLGEMHSSVLMRFLLSSCPQSTRGTYFNFIAWLASSDHTHFYNLMIEIEVTRYTPWCRN